MATQALYRRYRPRRFSEVRGQEHIVRALRNAVINHREGQAYLFSGPRGTGKTTSARILAKVLNCERPVDGEPCCECESCLAVERGTSYDVHELDAASNNGVDAMRDLIEKASLGTPGRHKVYILDEVHMLSKAAEAALLKTLEEPPPHVVFVLATTDPQKVSDTIRSRTQHLRFHLLPMDELEQHVRWVIDDAGLDVSESAIQSVLEQGGGSARDTLSALELVASAGGDQVESVQYGEFVEAFIDLDPGRALTAVAFAAQQGREARGVTEDLLRHLRDCFLSLMAPELVALPDAKAQTVAEQAARLGAAKVVRAMERLGEMLVEMRHAPDPRLLLEVALVQLTHDAAAHDVGALLARIERLEQAVASGQVAAPRPAAGGAPAAPAATPKDPATGRVQLGGGARRDLARPATGGAGAPTGPMPAASSDPAPAAPASSGPAAPAAPAAGGGAAERALAAWGGEIQPLLKGYAKALYAVVRPLGARDGALVLGAPSEPHRQRCEQNRGDVEAAIERALGTKVPVVLQVDDGPRGDHGDDPGQHGAGGDDSAPVRRPSAAAAAAPSATRPAEPRPAPRPAAPRDDARAGAAGPAADPGIDAVADVVPLHPAGTPTPDEEIDLDDLVDAPPEHVVSPIERLAQAFPGSELLDERR